MQMPIDGVEADEVQSLVSTKQSGIQHLFRVAKIVAIVVAIAVAAACFGQMGVLGARQPVPVAEEATKWITVDEEICASKLDKA